MISIKEVNLVVTELFIRRGESNISLVLITQLYFEVPKNVRLNTIHFFVMKIPNKRELQQIAANYYSDIDSNEFKRHCNKCIIPLTQIIFDHKQYSSFR